MLGEADVKNPCTAKVGKRYTKEISWTYIAVSYILKVIHVITSNLNSYKSIYINLIKLTYGIR